MKKIVTLLFLSAAINAQAQTKILTQAVITTKTTTVSPGGEEANTPPPPPPSGNGEEIRVVRFGGDGETKTVTTLKGDMIKTYTETDMSRTSVIRDNGKKITTTLMEMMGTKTGFYATDEEQEQMRKRMDSMLQSRRQGNDNNTTPSVPTGTEISYVEESKKIAGLVCKKAFVIITRQNGTKDSTAVWYCPNFKFQGLPSTGGLTGFGGMGRTASLNGLSDLAGFPMQYEMKLPRGRKMIVEVTKINIEQEVADKEFEIPKDFTLKPMKDMQNGGDGRMFQMRIGGPTQ
jgi:hypothetical protein